MCRAACKRIDVGARKKAKGAGGLVFAVVRSGATWWVLVRHANRVVDVENTLSAIRAAGGDTPGGIGLALDRLAINIAFSNLLDWDPIRDRTPVLLLLDRAFLQFYLHPHPFPLIPHSHDSADTWHKNLLSLRGCYDSTLAVTPRWGESGWWVGVFSGCLNNVDFDDSPREGVLHMHDPQGF